MQHRSNSTDQQLGRAALPRRDCLKALGAAVLAAPALGAAGEDLRAKARRNIKLGVDASPYGGLPVEEAARRIHADGFSNVLTQYAFADVRFDPLAPDWKAAEKIVGAFERQGIQIAAVFGYVNIVSPDPVKRNRGHDRMVTLIKNWKRLGCSNISTETGTFNLKTDWVEAPENATEQGYRQCRTELAVLAGLAEKAGAVVSIEPYWRNVIGSVDRTEQLFREVNSPALKLVMDPCNYFRKEELPRMRPMLEDMFRRLGPRIVVAHAKDVKASADGTDLPAAGLGVLDYPLYLRLLAQLDREMYLVIEHVGLKDVPRARDYVLAQFDRI